MAETPPVCVRMQPALVRRIDAAARARGWTRTNWVLYWLGKGLDHDEDVYAPTPEQVERDRANAAEAVERTRRWRKARREQVTGTASPGTTTPRTPGAAR